MRIRDAPLALLTIFILVSMLGCGNEEGGNNASLYGQNHLQSDNLSSTTKSENPLIGTWFSGRHSLTFKSGNTYFGDLNRDGIPAVWGSVVISGNVAIFTDAEDSNSCTQKDDGQIVNGSYTYTISGNTLSFSLVHDSCSVRENRLSLSYQKRCP